MLPWQRYGAGAAHMRQQRGQAQALEGVQRGAQAVAVDGRGVCADLMRKEAGQALLPGALHSTLTSDIHPSYLYNRRYA